MLASFRLFDRPYLLLVLANLFWAGNIVLGRYIAHDIPPVTLSFLRWAGAMLLILPFTWKELVEGWPVIRQNLVLFFLLSACGIGSYNAIAYWGLKYTEALNALLIQSLGPLLVALWGFLLWRDRLSPRQLGGILTSLIGVVVILMRGDITHLASLRFNIGDVLTLAALVIYGLYASLLRKRPDISPLAFLAVTIVGGTLFLLPLTVWELVSGTVTVNVTPKTVATVFYMALFASLLAYLFFIRGAEIVGNNRASPFFHLMPVFGSVIAILFLGETPHLFHAIGFALVLSGVFVATTARTPLAAEPAP